jgi:hypothetical protein
VKNDIQTIIDALIPLYAQSEDDLPTQALWNHPDIEKIYTIQNQLINLLFPGRSIGKTQPLDAFFKELLTQLIPPYKSKLKKHSPFAGKPPRIYMKIAHRYPTFLSQAKPFFTNSFKHCPKYANCSSQTYKPPTTEIPPHSVMQKSNSLIPVYSPLQHIA